MKKLVGFHGEVVPVQIDRLPEGSTRMKLKNDYVVVGLSEVTGNDHRIKVKDREVEFYEKNGVLYMRNMQEVELGCVIEERHDTCILPTGIWEFKKALEFDPLEKILREAAD